jgi:alkylation response protein AidB-like acyl-CoA dehydrogenase
VCATDHQHGLGDDLNETFVEHVRAPVKNLIGEEHRGWYVGMTLLDFERSGLSGVAGARRNICELVAAATGEARDRARLDEGSVRSEMADRAIAVEVS